MRKQLNCIPFAIEDGRRGMWAKQIHEHSFLDEKNACDSIWFMTSSLKLALPFAT